MKLFDIAAGKPVGDAEFGRHPEQPSPHSRIEHVLFSPDGKLLAVVDEQRAIRLTEVATGAEKARFVGHTGEIRSLAFSGDGRFQYSGSADTTAVAWKVPQ